MARTFAKHRALDYYDRKFIRFWLRGQTYDAAVGASHGEMHTALTNSLCRDSWRVADVVTGSLWGYYFDDPHTSRAGEVFNIIATELKLPGRFCTDTKTFDGRKAADAKNGGFIIAGPLTVYAYRAKHTPLP